MVLLCKCLGLSLDLPTSKMLYVVALKFLVHKLLLPGLMVCAHILSDSWSETVSFVAVEDLVATSHLGCPKFIHWLNCQVLGILVPLTGDGSHLYSSHWISFCRIAVPPLFHTVEVSSEYVCLCLGPLKLFASLVLCEYFLSSTMDKSVLRISSTMAINCKNWAWVTRKLNFMVEPESSWASFPTSPS